MAKKKGAGGEGGELRPERLGEELRMRPAPLGGDASKHVSPFDGWLLDPEGTTAGRLFRFESMAQMQEFVAELQGVLDTLVARRAQSGPGRFTLIVFLAGHSLSGGARDSG